MNLRQLEAFLWVSKLGSFSKTAERLYTTQPAISSRISNLEQELGVALFERAGGGARLSASGRSLLPLAEQALGAIEAIRDQVGGPVEASGLIRLGVSETVVQTWLPELLAHLRETYPNLDVEITVDVTTNLRDAVVNHGIDLAFLLGPVSAYTVTNIPLLDYVLTWVTKPPAPGVKRIQASMHDILRLPILTFPRNTRPYAQIEDYFRRLTGQPPRIFTSTSLSACLKMAEHGVGTGAMPHAVVGEAVADGRLCVVECEWTPSPLQFTASFIDDKARPELRRVAEMAAEIAGRA